MSSSTRCRKSAPRLSGKSLTSTWGPRWRRATSICSGPSCGITLIWNRTGKAASLHLAADRILPQIPLQGQFPQYPQYRRLRAGADVFKNAVHIGGDEAAVRDVFAAGEQFPGRVDGDVDVGQGNLRRCFAQSDAAKLALDGVEQSSLG